MKYLWDWVIWCCALGMVVASFNSTAMGQGPTFSVDWQGPTAGGAPGPSTGLLDAFNALAIDEGSILTPGVPATSLLPNSPSLGPIGPPGLLHGSVAAVGAPYSNLGIVPSTLNQAVEMDALSYGRDLGLGGPVGVAAKLFFSVDEFGAGDIITPAGAPSVFSEGASIGLAAEASADVFAFAAPFAPLGLPAGGPPFFTVPGNVGVFDGNGMLPWGAAGFGLVEPNPPTFNMLPDAGDNLDALDVKSNITDSSKGRIFFSLDSRFADPFETVAGAAITPNNGTAISNGFVGGDVLVNVLGAAPRVYASAASLGLDLSGPDTDDLDALALLDDGYVDPNSHPVFNPAADRIIFSVRRHSSVIGVVDSARGLRIEEGDILTVPAAGGPGTPAIVIPAEVLGLGTLRSGTNKLGQGKPGDDLDALDVVNPACDLTSDGLCDVLDLDLMYTAGILTGTGVPLAGPYPVTPSIEFDMDFDGAVTTADIKTWLDAAAYFNGYTSTYLFGDTDGLGTLGPGPGPRSVDITDFTHFLYGFTGTGITWGVGNFDGDHDVDITDFSWFFLPGFVSAGGGVYNATQAPEPGGILLLSLGAMMIGYIYFFRPDRT